MFTPCSLSSRLTGSLRIFPGLPAPIPPFPPSSQYIFSQSFPLASPVVLGSCQTPATLWEAGPPIPKPNKWEKGNRKKKVPVHVDTLKTLFPSETLEPSAAPLGNCRRHSADLAFLTPAEQRYCPSFLLPHKDPYVHPASPPLIPKVFIPRSVLVQDRIFSSSSQQILWCKKNPHVSPTLHSSPLQNALHSNVLVQPHCAYPKGTSLSAWRQAGDNGHSQGLFPDPQFCWQAAPSSQALLQTRHTPPIQNAQPGT